MKKVKNSEKGFTLLEVMVSALIVLTMAAVSMQLLLAPKQKVLELEMRAEISRYLNNKIQEVKEMPSFPTSGTGAADITNYCSPAGSCNANICGSDFCNTQYAAKCATNPAATDDNGRLAAIVSQIPSVCFVHVKMNIDCGAQDNDQATQVCLKAEWPKKGNMFHEEALTAYLVK